MTGVSIFLLGTMLGVALPFAWFAVDSRRTKRRKVPS